MTALALAQVEALVDSFTTSSDDTFSSAVPLKLKLVLVL